MNPLNFCFKIGVPTKAELRHWGDYFLARSFGEELERNGHNFTIQLLPEWHTDKDYDADIIIHLRGLSKYKVKPHHFNIMWVISHPDEISIDEYNEYDLILVASEVHAQNISRLVDVPVKVFYQFVDTNYFYCDRKEEFQNQLLFVGNSRGVFRKIVEDIVPPPRELSVYGKGWKGLISSQFLKGSWFPNEKLRHLYSSCDILLNDHWEDMKNNGFINNRFYDAIACQAIVINDDHPEIKRQFPKALTYNTRENLLKLIEDIYKRPQHYKNIAKELNREILKEHSVSVRVIQFLQILNSYNIYKNIEKTKQKITFKQYIKQKILDIFGYGKIYRFVHRTYITMKQLKYAIRKKRNIPAKIWDRVLKKEGTATLINVTNEAEIKALASYLARPFRLRNDILVSIIIPTKNGSHHLKLMIPHLLNNTLYNNYEVLIIDNNSSDGTEKYILGLNNSKIRYFNTQSDLNFSQSLNFGVKHAKGRLIVFLNNDVVPLYGWLDELLSTYFTQEQCAIVGSRLIYNELTSTFKSREFIYPGCSVQHDGIRFKISRDNVIPYNAGKYKNPLNINNEDMIEEVPAVTAACLLTSKEMYKRVGGFDETYQFGKEDVDYSLKVREAGGKIFINRSSLLLHREFTSQIKVTNKKRKSWRLRNDQIFNSKWNNYLRKEIWEEKLYSRNPYWSETPLKIAFLVTENHPDTTAGDLFSAQMLGEGLIERYGYQISYIPRRPNYEWDIVPDSIDIVVAMRHDFDIRKSNISSSTIKVAWIRGYIHEWLNKPWIHEYDGIITSSSYAMTEVKKIVPHEKCWGVVPLGVSSIFLNQDFNESDRDIDVCFVGNIFEIERDIVKNLDLTRDFNFHFYGRLEAGSNHPWKKFHRGSIKHKDLPALYQRSKIVIEDTAPFNIGTVNLRVYEAASCGALVIANRTPGIEEIFQDNVIIYDDKQDLSNKVRYYLENDEERLKVAQNVRSIVLGENTYLHRAEKLRGILVESLIERLT